MKRKSLKILDVVSILTIFFGIFWRLMERPRLLKFVAEADGGIRLSNKTVVEADGFTTFSMWDNFKFWIEPWDILFHAGVVFLATFVILDLLAWRADKESSTWKITPFRILEILLPVTAIWKLAVLLWRFPGFFLDSIPWSFLIGMAISWLLIRRAIRHGWETRSGRKAWRYLTVIQFISMLAILAGALLYHFPLGFGKSFSYNFSFICVDGFFGFGHVFANKYLLWPGIVLLAVSVIADLATRRKHGAVSGKELKEKEDK